jgi:cell wall-associated NlpC family hydrolase
MARAVLLALLGLLLAAAPALAQDEDAPWWADEADVQYGQDWEQDGWDPDALDLPTVPWLPEPAPAAPQTQAPAPVAPQLPVVTGRQVPGRTARMRADGRAAIPRGAPKRVRRIIAAANQIIGKPYKWGGGHARLLDSGYDCSGAVGYALIRAGLMRTTMASGSMAHWAAPGTGRWVSVYANRGHVYLEVAGLRLDTSPVGDPQRRSGVRWRPVIGRRAGFHARHPVGL